MPATRIPLPTVNGYQLFAVTEIDDGDGHETRSWIEIQNADGDLIETCDTETEAVAVIADLTGDGLNPR